MSPTRSLCIPLRRPVVRLLAFATAAPLLAACSGDVQVDTSHSNVKGVAFVRRDTARPLGPGDIRVPSSDGAVEVALIGDSIVAGLGPRVRAEIKRKTDTTKVDGDGLGASLEKFVKGTVATALDHEMEFPVSQISDVRYEDGLLRFYDNDGHPMHLFERDRHGGDRDAAVFREADAQAFIAAFKARKQKT